MESRDNYRFSKTMETARSSSGMNYELGAIVFRGKNPLGSGVNTDRSRMKLPARSSRSFDFGSEMKGSNGAYHSASLHAEIAALRNCFSQRLEGKDRYGEH